MEMKERQEDLLKENRKIEKLFSVLNGSIDENNHKRFFRAINCELFLMQFFILGVEVRQE